MSTRAGGWLKRLGLLGVVFFAAKGLIWLALMGGMASMGAGWFSLGSIVYARVMATPTKTYTTGDIAQLFPNLMDIRDAGLRDKVAAVWNEALNAGCGGKGWTFDEIRAIPFTLLAGKIDMRFVEHLNSCCKQCIAIAGVLKEVFGTRVPVNLDYLIAGSLLADVGKMLEFDKDTSGSVVKGRFGDMLRHPFSGVALCYKHGIPAEVMHIVATHSHEGDKVERTIESWIFHHADFIDFDIAKVLGKQAGKAG